ncbi:hypothetical protein E2C01_045492 [Portunus trituberculatus]|uniref:Uncharacterized protein n=1 Tax=Portunus trituberculatus TaxID=210409 RepID=A0A5B7FVY0_PORTR|nr:hypothetical protein [Portunus trituberculatus]
MTRREGKTVLVKSENEAPATPSLPPLLPSPPPSPPTPPAPQPGTTAAAAVAQYRRWTEHNPFILRTRGSAYGPLPSVPPLWVREADARPHTSLIDES